MVFRRAITLTLACLLLAVSIAGCGCQAEKPMETAEASVSAQETQALREKETVPETTAEATAETEVTEVTEATKATKPAETTEPTENDFWDIEVPEDTRPPIEVTIPEETQPYTDYEKYMDMSGEEQEKFFKSFENEQAFFDWFNAAKDEYEKAHPPVIIDGSTNIEIKP